MSNKNKIDLAVDITSMFPFFDLIQNGIALTDQHSKIIYVNPAYTKITGYSYDYAVGLTAGFNRSGYHDEFFYKKMWSHLLSTGFWEGEIWNRAESGRVYPSLLTINALKSNNSMTTNYIAIFSDITFLEAEKGKKINLAFNDPLTALPNRLAIDSCFNIATQENMRQAYKLKKKFDEIPKIAFLFMDVDKFKSINDEHGHVVGDKFLKEIANRLRKISRATDTFGRFGGDEFVGIISGVKNISEINAVCERIQAQFAIPFLINDIQINSNISIGVSIYPDEATTLENLIKMADKAMYFAKNKGSKFAFYSKIKNVDIQ